MLQAMKTWAIAVTIFISGALVLVAGLDHLLHSNPTCPVVTGTKWMPSERSTNRIFFNPIPMGEE